MPPPLQISIPSTATSPSPKPHTTYNVTLTLPLRSHILQKRYSDFTALHSSLESETHAAPPATLPPKTWLRSTVSSPELVESRRRSLESYLRAILDADDGRWRQSKAWRTFLRLPESLTTTNTTTAGTVSSRDGAGDDGGGREKLDANGWLGVHREVKGHIHNARSGLRKREAAGTTTEQHATAAEVKGELVRAATGIARCEGSLRGLSAASSGGGGGGWDGGLGEGEIRRRRDLLVAARKEVEGLEVQLRALMTKALGAGAEMGSATASKADKQGLWEGTSAALPAVKKGRVLGPAKETERTRELDNKGVLQLQKQVMQEQEEDVLEIGKAVSRMKEMGILINEELVVQNQMLGMLEGDVDRVQGKLDVGKKRMAKIS